MALDMGTAAVTAALLLFVGLDAGGPARVLLALAFVSFVPGWAVLGWGPFEESGTKVAVAVVLSLTLCTALSLAQLWLRWWRPQVVFDLTAATCLVAILAHLLRDEREPRR
jgi:hypothetical protein